MPRKDVRARPLRPCHRGGEPHPAFRLRLRRRRAQPEGPAGICYGIVGPNGAGKTTTLIAVCGLREPTSGSITIAGHDLRADREAALAQLGVMMDGDPCLSG
ncbi:ATP-binding cassette domain-containing protein [Streptosporangium sp. CA-115845]|uniref:ATP-binding cassette domain-containing protein n=1 Tax=Streptosporangium sp. CA-115845 TaxID=3240071 RepID=UPI003D939645